MRNVACVRKNFDMFLFFPLYFFSLEEQTQNDSFAIYFWETIENKPDSVLYWQLGSTCVWDELMDTMMVLYSFRLFTKLTAMEAFPLADVALHRCNAALFIFFGWVHVNIILGNESS